MTIARDGQDTDTQSTRGGVADVARGPSSPDRSGATLQLALATLGFLVNFWAWALLGPLGPGHQGAARPQLRRPVPAGGRAGGGRLAGPHPGRRAHRPVRRAGDVPAGHLATIVPVLTLSVVSSYPALIVTGFFLGIGGTAFAVGVPLVSGWYPPARRGFAIGVFGVGMGGTAIANFTTVRLADAYGARTPFLLVAAILAGYAVLSFLLLRDAPGPGPAAPGRPGSGSPRSAG